MDDGGLTLTLEGPVTRWPAGSWHFLAVGPEESDVVRARTERRGFGSVRVTARLGGSTWSTSLFPDSTSGCYLLPVKAAVRTREGITDGTRVRVVLTLAGI